MRCDVIGSRGLRGNKQNRMALLSLCIATSRLAPPQMCVMTSPPIALRCLDRQEVLDKLNAVPVFSLVNGQEQLLAEPDADETPVCRFYLELSEAQSALKTMRDANPNVAIDLSITPLGTAFALSEWQESVDEEGDDGLLPEGADELEQILEEEDEDDDFDDYDDEMDMMDDSTLLGLAESEKEGGGGGGAAAATPRRRKKGAAIGAADLLVRLQASKPEIDAAQSVLSKSPAPPLLRRRNEREGPIPLFGSDRLRFKMPTDSSAGGFESSEDAEASPEIMTPIFFRREDFGAAWVASGGAVNAVPPVQVTDLRTLAYQMQYDTEQDWRPMLLVAPDPAIEYVRERQAAAEAAEAAKSASLSRNDVQGLIFGGGGAATPEDDMR